jgi:tetratricopeptide (TPR) repeat protein
MAAAAYDPVADEARYRLQAALATGQGIRRATAWACRQHPALCAPLLVTGLRQYLADHDHAAIESFVQESAERAGEPDFPQSAAVHLIAAILASDTDAGAPLYREEDYPRAARVLVPSLMAHWPPEPRDIYELVNAAANAPSQLGDSGAARAWHILAAAAPDSAPPDAGELEEAVVNYTTVLDRDASSRWALTGRALAARLLGRPDEALADYERIFRLNPGAIWALCRRAEIYLETGQHEMALVESERGLGLRPSAEWALSGRGAAHQALGRYADAVADYDAAIAAHPDAAWAFVGRAEAYRSTDRWGEALSDLDRALELAPDDGWALGQRARAHRMLGQLDAAVADSTRALELRPDLPLAFAQRGWAYLDLGRTQDAVADFGRAIEMEPDYGYAFIGRGEALMGLSRTEEAIDSYTAWITAAPDEPEGYCRRADCYVALDDHERAAADYDRAVALAPGSHGAACGRANALMQADRYAEAVAEYGRAIPLSPDPKSTALDYCGRGLCLKLLVRYEDAVADYRSATEAYPQGWMGWYEYGMMQLVLDQPEDGLRSCDRAIALAPDEVVTYTARASAYLELDRVPDALADAERAIALDPGVGLACRGEVMLHSKRWRDAVSDFSRAIDVAGINPWYALCRADAYRELGQYGAALADYDYSLSHGVDDDAQIFSGRGRSYLALGRTDEARSELLRAIELDSDLAAELQPLLDQTRS